MVPRNGRVELPAARLADVGPMCARAFDDYPYLAELYPGDAKKRAEVSRRFYGATAADCSRHGVVHAVFEDERLAGIAAWLRPGAYPVSLRRSLGMLPVAWAALRYHPHRSRLGIQSIVRLERHHPNEPPHWYLAAIAVDPSHQGKGIGNALIRGVLDLADSRGEPCMLETAKAANRDWYERLGFVPQIEEPAFDGGPLQWFMWREPQSPASAPPA